MTLVTQGFGSTYIITQGLGTSGSAPVIPPVINSGSIAFSITTGPINNGRGSVLVNFTGSIQTNDRVHVDTISGINQIFGGKLINLNFYDNVQDSSQL
jgi:hypothetical protein